MLSFVGLWNFRTPQTPLYIHDFREVRYVSSEIPQPNDIFVYKKPGGIMLEYYNKKDEKLVTYDITLQQVKSVCFSSIRNIKIAV